MIFTGVNFQAWPPSPLLAALARCFCPHSAPCPRPTIRALRLLCSSSDPFPSPLLPHSSPLPALVPTLAAPWLGLCAPLQVTNVANSGSDLRGSCETCGEKDASCSSGTNVALIAGCVAGAVAFLCILVGVGVLIGLKMKSSGGSGRGSGTHDRNSNNPNTIQVNIQNDLSGKSPSYKEPSL